MKGDVLSLVAMNPWRSLKALPWGALFGAAAIATLSVWLLDAGLIVLFTFTPGLEPVLKLLLSSAIQTLCISVFGVLLGATSVMVLETVFYRILINGNVLWALILALLLTVAVQSWLPWQPLFLVPGQPLFIGLVLGIFGYGRRYWY
jgi:hypothetical protein